jgi:hypothetical protein
MFDVRLRPPPWRRFASAMPMMISDCRLWIGIFELTMKLPRADLATVPERKITDYLLNPAHPAGGSKAVFFLRFGYAASHWGILAADILRHACENEIATVENVPYVKRYVVDGLLTAPDGTRLNIRSAWFIDHGTQQPRFITAHPLPKKP